MGAYYIDGPVFLKSGVDFYGDWRDDDPPFATWLYLHDVATSASVDGIMNADGVSDVTVRCRDLCGAQKKCSIPRDELLRRMYSFGNTCESV